MATAAVASKSDEAMDIDEEESLDFNNINDDLDGICVDLHAKAKISGEESKGRPPPPQQAVPTAWGSFPQSKDTASTNNSNDSENKPDLTDSSKSSADKNDESDDDDCVICLDKLSNPKELHKCSHKFCTDCIDRSFKNRPVCPICFVPYGIIMGNQPEGYMHHNVIKRSCSGYNGIGTIVIYYSFCDGTQTEEHPHPGLQYWGTDRTAYLPDNEEGRKVLGLLKVAFDRRLVFTVGRSRTTGRDNVVTWNDIHHKTNMHGGPQEFGYPDPTYLSRIQEELAAVGVTGESLRTANT